MIEDQVVETVPRDEHYACASDLCSENQWHAMFEAVRDTVTEEAASVRSLVRDSDSSCPARTIRKERLAALEWVLNLVENLERWEW